jgi:hypothetical protein
MAHPLGHGASVRSVPRSIYMLGFALVVLASGCRDRAQDDCERALARIARIDARSSPSQPAIASKSALQQCRSNPNAMSDPVVRCALDSASDGAAAVCIDNFTRAVLKTSADGGGGGAGINPLLQAR